MYRDEQPETDRTSHPSATEPDAGTGISVVPRSPDRLLLGLTGGMASGKSTVAKLLRAEGCLVVDADHVVAELYAPGGAGSAKVRELFGPEALDAEGAVKAVWVAQRVFGDAGERARLEAAIHPLVRHHFRDLAEQSRGVVVLEATLLVEAGYGEDFDLVLSVEADEGTRLRRAIGRGMDEASAKARLAAQGDGQPRRQGADRLLRNDGTLEELQEKVKALAEELQACLTKP